MTLRRTSRLSPARRESPKARQAGSSRSRKEPQVQPRRRRRCRYSREGLHGLASARSLTMTPRQPSHELRAGLAQRTPHAVGAA